MTDCTEHTVCRVCQSPLDDIIDLGEQALGGQFPLPGEPDPPRFPLVLARCLMGCGLVQLRHTVAPTLLFSKYHYRSSVTATMRRHLADLATEAWGMLPGGKNVAYRALDIGGNDGALLSALPAGFGRTYLIDPSDVPVTADNVLRHERGFFPKDLPNNWPQFDLIFTVACFYDVCDPVGFARAVASRLTTGGLWCVEVADAGAMIEKGYWDSICHEHLAYFDEEMLTAVLVRSGLEMLQFGWHRNPSNGGSIRAYARRGDTVGHGQRTYAFGNFADRIRASADAILGFLRGCKHDRKVVHLLGASTKASTWLQYAHITPDLIGAASDRDPRKVGRRTPGTNIPIISEDESRALRPDVYVCPLYAFKSEIVSREKEFLDRGGILVFPLPKMEVVRR